MSTHTYVTVPVSERTYNEIKCILDKAGYSHAFIPGGAIDMHGLALVINIDDCEHHNKVRVDSPANCVDHETSNSRESYVVYKCQNCKHIIGVRHQWDSGTGCDDRMHDFGIVDPATVIRHY